MDPNDLAGIARRLADGVLVADDVLASPDLTEQDKRDVFALAVYTLSYRHSRRGARRKAQRRANALLRSFLTNEQRAQLSQSRSFLTIGSGGGIYRLYPESGGAHRVERHGRRWYTVTSYCLHDPGRELPPADVTVSHLLLLTADEPTFLAMANAYGERNMAWDGAWRRRCNAARRARESAA